MTRERLQLQGFSDPYRGDHISRLGPDGQPSGAFSTVKSIISSHPTAGIYEVCDDANRVLYIIREAHHRWLEIEL
jgi:hypothetical protein